MTFKVKDGIKVNNRLLVDSVGNIYGNNLVVEGTLEATYISGNTVVEQADKWATPRALNISGDVTGNVTFDGSTDISLSLELSNTGVTPGTYGSTTQVPTITVDEDGRVTQISSVNGDFATILNISGNTGSDPVNLKTDTLSIVGGNAISTTVTNNTVTVNHADTSSVSNISSANSGSTVTQNIDVQFDTFGHVTSITTSQKDLSEEFYTKTDSDTRYVNATGDTVSGNLAITQNLDVTGNITTSSSTVNLLNQNATNISFAGAATALSVGATTGTTTVRNNLSVSGNLIVNGTTTTVNSTTVTVDDPVITLGGDTPPTVDDNKDRGVEFRYHTGTTAKRGFFGFDDSTGYFTFFSDATNASEVFSGTIGDILATNFRGNLIGGTVNATNGTFTGTVSIEGNASLGNAPSDVITLNSQLSVAASVGASGQVLTSRGAGQTPIWQDQSAQNASVAVVEGTGTATDYYLLLSEKTTGQESELKVIPTKLVFNQSTGLTVNSAVSVDSIISDGNASFNGSLFVNSQIDGNGPFTLLSTPDLVNFATNANIISIGKASTLNIFNGEIQTPLLNVTNEANFATGSVFFNTLSNESPFKVFSNIRVENLNSELSGKVENAITSQGNLELVKGNLLNSDAVRISAIQSATNGSLEIATSGQGSEPILVKQFTSNFQTEQRVAKLLDENGNTSFPGNLEAAFVRSNDVTSTSDKRLKINIERINNALNIVDNLCGYEFDFSNTGKHSSGVIAQEVEEILPHIVDNGSEFKSVSYIQLIPYLIESIKELNEKIKMLENKNR